MSSKEYMKDETHQESVVRRLFTNYSLKRRPKFNHSTDDTASKNKSTPNSNKKTLIKNKIRFTNHIIHEIFKLHQNGSCVDISDLASSTQSKYPEY